MTNQEAIERIERHIIIHGAKEPRAVHITEALNMAIEALKAQEPKKSRCIRRLTKVMKGICPVCEMEIESVIHGRITKFCKFCGQAVKWDD